MDEQALSWGYFTDHNPFEPHCNAHPNNFLVLDLQAPPPSHHPSKAADTTPKILAPLDFDMTYEFCEGQAFVSTLEDVPASYGSGDREQFDSWSGQEKYELEKALGGEENMANFAYEEAPS